MPGMLASASRPLKLELDVLVEALEALVAPDLGPHGAQQTLQSLVRLAHSIPPST